MANPTNPTVAVGPGGITNTFRTYRPNSTVTADGSVWSVQTAAGFVDISQFDEVTSDDVDTSLASPFWASGAQVVGASLGLPAATFPALAQVRYVQARLRTQWTTVGVLVELVAFNSSGGSLGFISAVENAGTATTFTFPAWTPSNAQIALDGSTFSNWGVGVIEQRPAPVPSFQIGAILEIYVDVWYNQAPVATPTGPVGTITTSSRPAISHSYADPEGDVQERYRRKIFQRPAAGWPSDLDPATGHYTGDGGTALVPIVDFGEKFSASTMDTFPKSLLNGVYRHYVQAADVSSGGRYGPWAFTEWTQAVPGPNAPTVQVVADQAHMAMDVIMAPATSGKATTYFVLQRSDDGGKTWVDVIGGDMITNTT